MVAVNEDWVWNKRPAASVKDPVSATATKHLRCRSEIRAAIFFLLLFAKISYRRLTFGDRRTRPQVAEPCGFSANLNLEEDGSFRRGSLEQFNMRNRDQAAAERGHPSRSRNTGPFCQSRRWQSNIANKGAGTEEMTVVLLAQQASADPLAGLVVGVHGADLPMSHG
ncbi:hypothetical protein V1284_003551 [Nitrobacteraceae bacterium AZCC 2299]